VTGLERSPDVATIELPERLDSTTAAAVEKKLREAMVPGARIIVDGRDVLYMSAAGVRALVGVLHGAELLEAHVVFCRFTGAAADCLDVSGFAQLLDVADSLEEASARLKVSASPTSSRLHPRRGAG
jgi:anti-sigma B factor antagonist